MNKKISNFLILCLLVILITIIFYNYSHFANLTLDISLIYLTKVFPFLFIMMVINNLLINLNFPYYLNRLVKSPALYIMIMSMISGSPLNAIIIAEFLQNKTLSEKDASLILAFTSFNNPLFLFNYFNLIFHKSSLIWPLFIIIYLTNIIIYLVLRKKLDVKTYKITYVEPSFTQSITSSLKKASLNMLNIFGTIFFFYLITNIIVKNNNLIGVLTKGLLEITQGLNGLVNLNVSLKIKELLTLIILQFQGLSIHIQIASILNRYNINYKYFYISRIALILLSCGIKMIL